VLSIERSVLYTTTVFTISENPGINKIAWIAGITISLVHNDVEINDMGISVGMAKHVNKLRHIFCRDILVANLS
jgi:hypothetical protein